MSTVTPLSLSSSHNNTTPPPSPLTTPPPQSPRDPKDVKKQLQQQLTPTEAFIAGGASGLMTRSVVAPLDVLKIRFQLQTTRGQFYRSIPHAFCKIIKEEGPRALWKGNLVGSMMASPYTAITFSAQKFFKHNLFPPTTWGDTTASALAGGFAGCVATMMTYPLDLLRSRFIAQEGAHGYNSLYHATTTIYRQQGLRGFFEGSTPAVLGIFPYMGVQFAVYEGLTKLFATHLGTIHSTSLQLARQSRDFALNTCHMTPAMFGWVGEKLGMKSLLQEVNNNDDNNQVDVNTDKTNNNNENNNNNNNNPRTTPIWIVPFIGLVSGSCGKAVSFPMDLLKRRMQMYTFQYTFDPQSRPPQQKLLPLAQHILRTEGFFAFYKGLVPSLLKSGPSASLAFMFYEITARFLLSLRAPQQQQQSSASPGGGRLTI